MEYSDIYGYIGGVLLVITLIPQLYLTYKSKKIYDISYIFIFLQIITCLFFLIYGISLKEIPIILANSILFIQLLLFLLLKKMYTKD